MRNLTAITVLTALISVGCAKNKEALVPGTWSGMGGNVDLKADKTFSGVLTNLKISGTWKMDGDDVVIQPQMIDGQSVQALKQKAMARISSLPKQAQQFVNDLDKPNVMTLSEDGKSMTTDKAKDTNSGPPVTMTKSSSA